ncbi:hypothetical protein OG301_31365 [Streptomyces platensis]|uniref:hypothetical protein n=1 Tax=Streptomyces platensis TaxID=58346 RepID=UPI002ED4AAE8|nr:hypothetical protein OG301_31365 [Streptomyces platensis]
MPRTGPPGRTPRVPAYTLRFPEAIEAFVFTQYACRADSAEEAAPVAVEAPDNVTPIRTAQDWSARGGPAQARHGPLLAPCLF